MAAQQEQPPAAGAATQERVAEVVFEALPDLQEQELIDLLDFIFTQHSGSAFNPDNTEKKDEIVQFLEGRPFASSERGVARCGTPPGNTPSNSVRAHVCASCLSAAYASSHGTA